MRCPLFVAPVVCPGPPPPPPLSGPSLLLTLPPCNPSRLQSLKVEVDYWGTLAQLNSALASSPLLRVAGVTTLSET